MSRVVTPKILLGLYFPAFLKISDAMGTVELTGFEIIAKHASGQTSAAADAEQGKEIDVHFNAQIGH